MNEIIVNLEGKEYQIDIQKAKELGVIKEKDTRCKSWEEFINKYRDKQGFIYNIDDKTIELTRTPIMTTDQLTKDEAIAIKAFSKLLKLRRDWIGDWEPDWNDNYQKKWIINFYQGKINLTNGTNVHFVLVFPTEEMRNAFYENFKDLIEKCKELL